MTAGMVVVGLEPNRMAGELVGGLLATHGIHAVVADEFAELTGNLDQTRPVRVLVLEADAPRALAILA